MLCIRFSLNLDKLKDKDFSPSSRVSTFIGKMVFLFFPCNQVELFQDSLFYILLCQKLAYVVQVGML